MAFAYESATRWEEARAIFEALTHSEQDREAGFAGLGEVCRLMGKYEESIRNYQKALAEDPKYPRALNGLGDCYRQQNRLGDAMDMYQQALRVNPDSVDAHFGLGACYVHQHDRAAALGEYKLLKAADADKAEELFNLIYPHDEDKKMN